MPRNHGVNAQGGRASGIADAGAAGAGAVSDVDSMRGPQSFEVRTGVVTARENKFRVANHLS